MQSQNRFFDDLSKVASGMVGTLAGMGREVEAMVRQQVEQFVGGMDFVRREEFDAVKDMAAAARAEADALKTRLAEIEARLPPAAG